jgi:alginate O-acetyltransferase complex protein AlgI
LMGSSTLIGFCGARLIEGASAERRRKVLLGVTVALLLGLLGAFKYAAFVGGNLTSFVGVITARGFPELHAFLNGIVLPIGISFYTFEGISYSVDVFRGKLPAERSLLRYAFFISFFPHLIAGPIVRYGMLHPQLLRKHSFDVDRLRNGLLLFALGLAKKTIVADGFATWVNRYLDDPSSLHAF